VPSIANPALLRTPGGVLVLPKVFLWPLALERVLSLRYNLRLTPTLAMIIEDPHE